jgi:lipopolysaccharide/colanic/teichoic acid biosynthesis glycosyltransferase
MTDAHPPLAHPRADAARLARRGEQAVAERRTLARATYRGLDLLIAGLGLLFCAPLLLLVCLLIRLESPGSPIFRQRRLGRERRAFTVHKLRTMRIEADPRVHREYVEQLINGRETTHSDGGRDLYKLAADDRVTRVGRWLRRTSLDELPQLIDVLRGRMSLVGPRPVIPYEAELYPSRYGRRFAVKPGLTGLWQVSGRSECTYREMVELDISWVERRSIGLYLRILVRTPGVLLRFRSAA